jgi:hypothetical protein
MLLMGADRRQILHALPLNTKNLLPCGRSRIWKAATALSSIGPSWRSAGVSSELSIVGKLPFNGIAAGDTPGSDAYLCNINLLEKVQNTKTPRFVI